MKNRFFTITIYTLIIFFLGFLAKGQLNNPLIYQQRLTQDMGGPFESSNGNSRYALVKAIVDHKTFILNTDLAKFSSPDVAKSKNGYFSIFTPGVSLLASPLYLLGQYIHFPQLTTYLLNIILALINLTLIYLIVKKLKFGTWTALLSGSLFIFATNAFTYAGTLTQHHAVTACLLSLILISISPITVLADLLFGLIWGLGLLMDIPFAIISLPISLAYVYQHFKLKSKPFALTINWKIFFAGLGLIFPIIIFGYYNLNTTGSISTLAQSVGQSSDFRGTSIDALAPELAASISATPKTGGLFRVYKTRNLIQGLYTLLISHERAIFYYSPLLVIALAGFIYYLRSNSKEILHPAFAAAAFGLVSYSMFGDPWGGWSFGPRYLIPSTAILCLFIPYVIAKLFKSKIFNLIFVILICVSVYINTLGALTSNLIPPEQEADFLVTRIPHNYTYNWQLINAGSTHSLLYILLFSKFITPLTFYYLFAGSISLFLSIIYLFAKNENTTNK